MSNAIPPPPTVALDVRRRLFTPRPPSTFRRAALSNSDMDGLLLDLKYAIRSIASAKKLALVVVATLALGIGANTAVFGVLHAVVLKPLPYAEPATRLRTNST